MIIIIFLEWESLTSFLFLLKRKDRSSQRKRKVQQTPLSLWYVKLISIVLITNGFFLFILIKFSLLNEDKKNFLKQQREKRKELLDKRRAELSDAPKIVVSCF